MAIRYPGASIQFVKQDWWVGVFWRGTPTTFKIWITIIPMFPLHIWWRK